MMEKGINSSMKKAFYGLDWTICFLWAIGVVVVGYGWFPYFPVNLVALMVLFRIVCSFALYKGEKKAWASGLVALALMALKWLMDADVHMWILTSKAYAVMGMEADKPSATSIGHRTKTESEHRHTLHPRVKLRQEERDHGNNHHPQFPHRHTTEPLQQIKTDHGRHNTSQGASTVVEGQPEIQGKERHQ